MILRFFILIGFVLSAQQSNAGQKSTETSKEKQESALHKRVVDLKNLNKQNFSFYRSVRKQIAANKSKLNNTIVAQTQANTLGVDNEASTIG